jgi:hypothetical protein
MSATMSGTIAALAAAALVGGYGDGLRGQPRESDHGSTAPQNQRPTHPPPPAAHPGSQQSGPKPPPNAQPRNPGPPPHTQAYRLAPMAPAEGPRWHGDIGQFREHDMRVWQGGHWQRGAHDGQLGWWWVVGGVWYFYPRPVYPYPDPFAPAVVAPPTAGASYWYYCTLYQQYYPYVATCPIEWRAVPTTP